MVFSLGEKPLWGTLGVSQSINEDRRGLSEADSAVDLRVVLRSPETARWCGMELRCDNYNDRREGLPSQCADEHRLTNIAIAHGGVHWFLSDRYGTRFSPILKDRAKGGSATVCEPNDWALSALPRTSRPIGAMRLKMTGVHSPSSVPPRRSTRRCAPAGSGAGSSCRSLTVSSPLLPLWL
jgi:hypothetical protein